jgi:acyl-[acyl-carrier-protein]-phospholipid O-acyltransferase / long-chain-fatty-acid--[acyl-carrier-protein] ligase
VAGWEGGESPPPPPTPGFAHAASSRTDAAKGEAIVLFTTAPALSRDGLLAAAKSIGAPELAVPRVVQRLSEIPPLGTGKTDYVRLKQMAETATHVSAAG